MKDIKINFASTRSAMVVVSSSYGHLFSLFLSVSPLVTSPVIDVFIGLEREIDSQVYVAIVIIQ